MGAVVTAVYHIPIMYYGIGTYYVKDIVLMITMATE